MNCTFNLLRYPVIFSLAFTSILFSQACPERGRGAYDFRAVRAEVDVTWHGLPAREDTARMAVPHPFVKKEIEGEQAHVKGGQVRVTGEKTRAKPAAGSDEKPARVFVLDPETLLEVKRHVAAGDRELKPAFDDLLKDADKALKKGPFTITDKKNTPPSGDVHDYTSLAPYWWPDPSKPDGLPYIRRDGQVNPEQNKFRDRSIQRDMCDAVTNLALAYYLSGNEAYAEHAVELLRVFFLDEKTKMNPNLNYSQAIKGQNTGRGSGIVETAAWIHLIDAFGMLKSSRAWTEQIDQGLRAWFGAFLDWLLTSENGKDESQSDNNHGTQYDAQVCAYALFLGKSELARQVMEQAKAKRIAKQIEPDGRQPRELARTASWDYSMINLRNLENMASLASKIGVDLWNYETPDGRGIRRVIQWHVPFAIGEKKWSYENIREFEHEMMFTSLRRAAFAYKEPQYEKWAEALLDVKPTDRLNLLYPKPKF